MVFDLGWHCLRVWEYRIERKLDKWILEPRWKIFELDVYCL